jgi:hypothetical protein
VKKLSIGLLVAFLALFSTFALAQQQVVNIDFSPRAMQAGFFSGPSGVTAAGNRVTNVLAGSITHDFASQTITCVDSASITVTGALVGDPCFVGSAVAPGNANFTCYVSATNTVLVHFCPAGTAVDPASQLFRVRVISSQ